MSGWIDEQYVREEARSELIAKEREGRSALNLESDEEEDVQKIDLEETKLEPVQDELDDNEINGSVLEATNGLQKLFDRIDELKISDKFVEEIKHRMISGKELSPRQVGALYRRVRKTERWNQEYRSVMEKLAAVGRDTHAFPSSVGKWFKDKGYITPRQMDALYKVLSDSEVKKANGRKRVICDHTPLLRRCRKCKADYPNLCGCGLCGSCSSKPLEPARSFDEKVADSCQGIAIGMRTPSLEGCEPAEVEVKRQKKDDGSAGGVKIWTRVKE
jgi:hypothetical protein